MLCVGLTGSIGSGKTTVANMFADLGSTIIDADLIARQVTQPGTRAYHAIVHHFGVEILTSKKTLDRTKLRQIIFNDGEARKWLEKTLHPVILDTIRDQLKKVTTPYCIVVIPLLVETFPIIDFLNRICVVDAPIEICMRRIMQRDQTDISHIQAIISAQSPREQRLQLADEIIANDQDLTSLQTQVKKLHQQYLQMTSS